METRQERFQKAKASLDKGISRISALADDAYKEAIACCGVNDLDNRERFTRIAAHLNRAVGEMQLARAMAGEVDGGTTDQPIARGGGT